MSKAKFITGSLITFGLGIAAGIFLSSDKGKKMTKEATQAVKGFYQEMADKAGDIKEMGMEEYQQFMADAAKKYAKTKKLSQETADYLVEEAKKSWDYLTDLWSEAK